MEIHKLNNDVLTDDGRVLGSEDECVGEVLKVTEMKQGVKNPNRVNVFVDNVFSFSLDVAQVVDFKLKVGKVLSENELEELKKASGFGRAYQKALEWALMRPRSVTELKDYLKRSALNAAMKKRIKEREKEREIKKFLEEGDELSARRMERKLARQGAQKEYDFSGLIIERLTARGYVDDLKFAKWYVENRSVKKGASRKKMQLELSKKGIGREIIDEIIGERVDEEEIKKIIARKQGKYTQEKLINYLCRQGFSYDLARRAVLEEE